tara:strand:- start:136 stop:249 length:114 start_codon:yes stop_codon:yes gene_type:complete
MRVGTMIFFTVATTFFGIGVLAGIGAKYYMDKQDEIT